MNADPQPCFVVSTDTGTEGMKRKRIIKIKTSSHLLIMAKDSISPQGTTCRINGQMLIISRE